MQHLGKNMNTKQVQNRINAFVQQQGRRPRILLAPLISDPSDRWTKPLAAFLAEYGFDVDIGPSRQTPIQAARLAIDNDVHLMCVSIGDATKQSAIVQLAKALAAEAGADIRLVAGGAGIQPNKEELYDAGVDLIVDYDTTHINLMGRMLDLLDESGPKSKP